MDTLDFYRETIERVMTEYAQVPYAHGEITTETVFDRKNDRYLMVNVGWSNKRRVYGCLVHMDIIDGKIWVQYDGTEEGLTADLERAGIPKEHIVLGFHPQNIRQYTDYAVA